MQTESERILDVFRVEEQGAVIAKEMACTYTDYETWSFAAEQAAQVLAAPESPARFIRTLAKKQGVDVYELYQDILMEAEEWEAILGQLVSERQQMENAVWDAVTPEDILAVKVGFAV